MCRILSNAEKYGYIAREISSIVAFPIKDRQAYNVKYEVENTLVSETGLVETSIKLKDAMDIVRKCVLLDHIGRMNDTEKTIKSVECAKSVSAYRKAKRKLQRLSPSKVYSSSDKGLSNTAAAKVINSKHYRARLLLQSITTQNLVTRSIRRIPTGLDANTFDAGINSYIRKYGIGGYLYRSADGKIYERRSDKFVINDLSMFAYVK